jgi:hypothetical protein
MEKQAKLVLAGGGAAEDSHPLDELFASWIAPQGRYCTCFSLSGA